MAEARAGKRPFVESWLGTEIEPIDRQGLNFFMFLLLSLLSAA